MKPRLIIFGTSDFGIAAFTAIADADLVDIVGVVTQPPRPVGRHKVVQPTPVQRWADDHHYPVFTPTTLKDGSAKQWLVERRPDVFLVASYGLIIPTAVLDVPTRGALNIHASLLPRHRGATPIAAAIAAGDAQTGVTFMLMDAGIDTGSTLRQHPLSIEVHDTRTNLERRLSELAATEIVALLSDWLAGKIVPQPQPTEGVTTCRRLTREDGRARWDDAAAIERLTRAYAPWPGVWTSGPNGELKILAARVGPTVEDAVPGTVIAQAGGWGIACRQGVLLPTEVQFEGRRPIEAKLVPGSYPGFVGSVLD